MIPSGSRDGLVSPPAVKAYRFGDVEVDPGSFRVNKAGRPVRLEPKAFDVLLFLVESGGRLVSKGELQQAVWKDTFVTESALTRLIAQLRRALGDDAHEAHYIETVPTRGYRFLAPVEREEPTDGHRPPVRPPSRDRLSVWTAGLALLALGAVFGWRVLRPPGGAIATHQPRRTPLTSSSALDDFPSFSPDGSSLAFSSDRSGRFEIYVRALAAGAREVPVTADGFNNTQPAWSPDGRWLAYHSMSQGGIWVVPALGGPPRRLTDFGSQPVWSPDGRALAFLSPPLVDVAGGISAGPMGTVWLVAAAGGAPRPLTRLEHLGGGHDSPSWSADGRRLAFTAGGRVFTVPANGGEPRALDLPGLEVYDVNHSADGRTLFMSGKREANFRVWRLPLEPRAGEPAGDPVELVNAGELPFRHLAVSRNGRWLAYTALKGRSDLVVLPVSRSGEPAGPPRNVTSGLGFRKLGARYSPDGRRLLFTFLKPGEGASAWMMGADGSDPRPLTSRPVALSGAGWFPDGRRIALLSPHGGRPTLWSLDLATGQEAVLLQAETPLSFPRLSPDGGSLAFQAASEGTLNVWTAALPGGPARPLTADPEGVGWPSWSPDGRVLAVELFRGGHAQVGVMPASGGPIRVLTTDNGQSWPHSFSSDGRRIAFAGLRDGVWNLYWVGLDGRQRRLTDNRRVSAFLRYPGWSPRGDEIVYESAEVSGNVWVMDLR